MTIFSSMIRVPKGEPPLEVAPLEGPPADP
jgi:hypothetical protein